jgi:GTPase SAR1 family protein
MYYRGADAVVIVYDMTDSVSTHVMNSTDEDCRKDLKQQKNGIPI